MSVEKRKKEIMHILNSNNKPISGSFIAKELGVSRQIIVQDIALLRASGLDISSTSRGYIINQPLDHKIKRSFAVSHTTEEILDELCTIVDHGGRILDVHVSHKIYGDISTTLIISNRQDVYDFVKQVEEEKVIPLKKLTNNIHYHTVEADSNEILDRIELALKEKNYLIYL